MKDMHLLNDPERLTAHISRVLFERNQEEPFFSADVQGASRPSAVMLLLGQQCGTNGRSPGPCLILNKRSRNVRQPGDLCCPGGGVSPRLDAWFARLLTLPGLPLERWSYWSLLRDQDPRQADGLAFLLGTGLRECFEEMRLNPFGVQFLGPLPSQPLTMFRQVIFPMAGWVSRQKRFFTNWEVEKVIYVPLSHLLNPASHACYRVRFSSAIEEKRNRKTEDFPCVLYPHQGEAEMLWGATYRIIMAFLDLVLGFSPPGIATLPVIHGTLKANYMAGSS